MKKIFLILSLFCFLFLFSCTKNQNTSMTNPPPEPKDTLAAGWKIVPLNDSSDLIDIFFINNTGFTAGKGPNIFKSTDGGNSWSSIPKPSTGSPYTYIEGIGMGSQDNSIFVQPLNVVISTHNGGGSFSYTPHNGTIISDAYFVDSSTAYAAGTSIWKTIDGGDNWTELYSFTTGAYYNDSIFYFSALDFLNEQTGWVFGNFGLYKTTNGGVNWQLISTPFDISRAGAIFFLNSDTGYVSNQNSVEKTMDGGISWIRIFTGTSPYHDIHFVSDETGYITDGTRIYKTVDGGNTWNKEVSLVSNKLLELHFTDPNHGWACGSKGTILKYSQ